MLTQVVEAVMGVVDRVGVDVLLFDACVQDAGW